MNKPKQKKKKKKMTNPCAVAVLSLLIRPGGQRQRGFIQRAASSYREDIYFLLTNN